MSRWIAKYKGMAGLPPGSVDYNSDTNTPLEITCIDYNSAEYNEKSIKGVDRNLFLADASKVVWLNIKGASASLANELNQVLGIHNLVLEDILSANQRPKAEYYENYFFLVIKRLAEDQKHSFIAEQISIIFGQNYIITFYDGDADVFKTVSERIKHNKGQVRKQGADYLAYAIVDSVVDDYYNMLGLIDSSISKTDNALLDENNTEIINSIHFLKQNIIFLRKHIWPLRQVVGNLQQNVGTKIINRSTGRYLRDLNDHIMQIIDTIDSFREIVSGLHDVYLSLTSNRMNQVMKVLTMFASIFIPLTFIAGIYGMNFENMPELYWRYGYYIVLGLMGGIVAIFLFFYKKNNWY
jgi:magnesium transporter